MRCLRCKQEIDRNFRACPHCGEALTDFARRFADEPLDGKYRILERLGTGGMGEVYKAEHTFLGATRVIKVIRPQISDSQDAHDRFLREARLATKVQHPNVATLHDFSALPDGSHYMVWEYIDGENLAQRLRTHGPLPPRVAVRLALQALNGLDAIHRAGIVHRDISPENLMIARPEDTVKIIDLGVAKLDDADDVSATRTGIFVGKLRYASPEQLGFLPESEKIDARSDLYAIGMVLYEMLAGRPPFEATSPHQYYLMHSEERDLRPIELPPDLAGGAELQEAVRRALQRDRTKRFASAREFSDALHAVEATLPDGAMKTVALPLDLDSTMRVKRSDTLQRSTLRTAPPPPVEPTIRTPLPAAPPAAAVHATSSSSSKALLVILGVLALFFVTAIAAGAWWLVSNRNRQTDVAGTTTANTAANVPPPAPAQTTVDVTETTAATDTAVTATATTPASATETSAATTTTQTTAPVPARPVRTPADPAVARQEPPRDARQRPSPPADDDAAEPATVAAAPEPATTYIEHGDDDANERHLTRLQREVSGVRRVAIRGGAMQDELVAAFRDELPHVEVASSAPVVIEFDGLLERQRLGRKTRYANASVRKNGRVIFRYLLPKEVYRAGDTPVEAFMRVMSDAFAE